MKHDEAIILFGKYPKEGFVKTRLAKTIGNAKALAFYKECLANVFIQASKIADNYSVYFYVAEAEDGAEAKQLAPRNIEVIGQKKCDLPGRIEDAFQATFSKGHKKVVIFSTDVPGLTDKHIKKSIKTLGTNNIVVGPDSDGGYYCLGMDRMYPELCSVSYGSAVGMFQQVVDTSAELDLRCQQLPELSDVDTYQDLMVFKKTHPDVWQQHYNFLSD